MLVLEEDKAEKDGEREREREKEKDDEFLTDGRDVLDDGSMDITSGSDKICFLNSKKG